MRWFTGRTKSKSVVIGSRVWHVWLISQDVVGGFGVDAGGFAVRLISNERLRVMSQLKLGVVRTLTILAVDKDGNPNGAMLDAPPVWKNSFPGAATDAPSGAEDVVMGMTPGNQTTITATAIIGGVTFTADVVIPVVSGAVTAGIKIIETDAPAKAEAGPI